MMRKEAREWCQYQDGEYIEHLKQQIVYFNERLVTRSMEGSDIADPIRRLLDLLTIELDMRQSEYRREYEDHTLQSSDETVGKKSTFKDGCSEAADKLVTNVKQVNPRPSAG